MSTLAQAYAQLATPVLLGHRGLSTVASENSLEAIEAAHHQGAGGVEIDVRPTACGTLVVMHDPTLARTTGDRRLVGRVDYDAIKRLRLNGGERVPCLDEAVTLCAELGLFLNIELKRDVDDRLEATRLLAANVRGLTRPTIVVSSFDPLMLAAFRWFAPEVPTALLVSPERQLARYLPRVLGADAIHPDRTLVSKIGVARWKRAGLKVMSFTVNDAAEAAQLLAIGVDGIITDDPARLKSLFDR